jgi:hypothetical protein
MLHALAGPRLPTHRVTALALGLMLLLPAGPVRAQSVGLCIDEMSDEDIERHTARIVGELRDHRTHARAWRFGWLAAYTGIAVVALGVLAPGIDSNTPDRDDRASRLGYIGAGIGASLAAARLAFYPMPDVWGARRIERMPTSTRSERIAQARYAESTLTSAGAWQNLMTGSSAYGLGIAWGIGWGTAIAIKYDNPLSSALAFLGSPVLSAATALTAPSWAALSSATMRGGICGHVYVEDREDPLGDEDAALGDDEDYEEDADEAVDPGGETDAMLGAPVGPTVMVYPTFGGAGLSVTF